MKTLIIAALALGLIGLQLAAGAADNRTSLSGGIGVGTMYGYLGANVEYRATPQWASTAGFGLNGEDAWFLGGRYYFKPEGTGVRTRVTVGLGTDEQHLIGPDKKDRSTGALFGIGWSWANADTDFRGFSFDLTTNGDASIGYHF